MLRDKLQKVVIDDAYNKIKAIPNDVQNEEELKKVLQEMLETWNEFDDKQQTPTPYLGPITTVIDENFSCKKCQGHGMHSAWCIHYYHMSLDNLRKKIQKGDESWFFICPHCKGNGRHVGWCPWLVRAIDSNPEKALVLKFTCQYCSGIKCHKADCWWEMKYNVDGLLSMSDD